MDIKQQMIRLTIALVALATVTGAIAPGIALAQSGGDGPLPTPPHNVYGDVVDGDGNAVADANIVVDSGGVTVATTTTDANGSYSINVQGVSEGDEMTVSATGGDVTSSDSETLTWSSASSDRVDLAVEVTSDDGGDNDDDGGGGGGGGGGAGTGGSGTGVDAPDISDDLGDDAEISGDSEAVIVTDPDTGRSTATFSDTSNVESITFSGEISGTVVVRNIDGIPAATGSPPGTSVTISDITVPEGARDSPATIRKRVSNDRLSDLGVEDQELAIYRFADGEWSQLDTGVASETDSGMILEAETPGFSFFAVSTVEDAPADDGGADDTATDDQESGGLNPTIIGLIGLVVLIAVGVGLYTRRE